MRGGETPWQDAGQRSEPRQRGGRRAAQRLHHSGGARGITRLWTHGMASHAKTQVALEHPQTTPTIRGGVPLPDCQTHSEDEEEAGQPRRGGAGPLRRGGDAAAERGEEREAGPVPDPAGKGSTNGELESSNSDTNSVGSDPPPRVSKYFATHATLTQPSRTLLSSRHDYLRRNLPLPASMCGGTSCCLQPCAVEPSAAGILERRTPADCIHVPTATFTSGGTSSCMQPRVAEPPAACSAFILVQRNLLCEEMTPALVHRHTAVPGGRGRGWGPPAGAAAQRAQPPSGRSLPGAASQRAQPPSGRSLSAGAAPQRAQPPSQQPMQKGFPGIVGLPTNVRKSRTLYL
eukprot:gene24889-biopygen23933